MVLLGSKPRVPVRPDKHITGTECLTALTSLKFKRPRMVPGFTYEALQKGTKVTPPKKLHIFAYHPAKETLFRTFFKRGDIPVAAKGRKIGRQTSELIPYPVRWFCDPAKLDYCYYLPIFIDGLSEPDREMRSLAYYGTMDLIQRAPRKILPVLPKVILPLKRAFNTRNKTIIISGLQVLQAMVTKGPCVGLALVPYYRQLLAVCNLYKNINVNLGDGVDQDREKRIGDVIEDTLRVLEACGGENAYINIKYIIPTYESSNFPKCDRNRKVSVSVAASGPKK